jgi:hypothetical protein
MATVNSSDNNRGDVTWTVSGGSLSTIIPVAGNQYNAVLNVNAAETALSLTVTVTSNRDTAKSANAEVTIIQEGMPVVESITVSGPDYVTIGTSTFPGDFSATVTGTNIPISPPVIWSVEGHTSTDETTGTRINSSTGVLFIASNESSTSLTIRAAYGGASGTKTVTVTSANILPKPNAPTLSNEGVVSWEYARNVNVTNYRLQLYKENAAVGDPILIPRGTFIRDILKEMRTEGVGDYTVTVTALGDGDNFATSAESDRSNTRSITQRSSVSAPQEPNAQVIEWRENGLFRWRNPDIGLNTGGAGTPLYDYAVRVFTHADAELSDSTQQGEVMNARRHPGQGIPTWTDFHLANAGVPAQIGLFYSVTVTALGDNLLVLDAEPSEHSPRIEYTVFGNSRVWTIVEGAGRFIAGADNGKIGWSDNGETWTLSSGTDQVIFGNNDAVRGIAYRATPTPLFVAVGRSSVAYSIDGKSWTAGSVTGDGDVNQLNTVIYDGSNFIAVGNFGQVIHSSNGTSWSRQYISGAGAKHLFGIANTAGWYLVFGEEGRTVSSSNGTSDWVWRQDHLFGNISHNINAAAFGENIFVIAGDNGQIKTATITTLNDNIGNFWYAWTSRTSGFGTTRIFNIIWSGSRFLAVGDNGRLSHSSTGTDDTWATRTGSIQTGFTTESFISAAIALPGTDNRFLLSGNEYSNGWGKMAIITVAP